MNLPLPPNDPTPRQQLTRGTATTAMEDIGGDIEGTTDLMDTMATMERDLLMKLPLPNLAPTLMPRLTRGTVITVMPTGLTVMVTTGTGHTATPTGDKKWTSTTSNNIRSFTAFLVLSRASCRVGNPVV